MHESAARITKGGDKGGTGTNCGKKSVPPTKGDTNGGAANKGGSKGRSARKGGSKGRSETKGGTTGRHTVIDSGAALEGATRNKRQPHRPNHKRHKKTNLHGS